MAYHSVGRRSSQREWETCQKLGEAPEVVSLFSPAVEAAGVRRPARIYDLRSTFASDALAAGVSVFELARIMGTSIEMVERHYGTLLDGSGTDLARRLDAYHAARDERESGRLGH